MEASTFENYSTMKEFCEEEERMKLRILQADAGLIGGKELLVTAERMDWMYHNPVHSKQAEEDYLLGKPLEQVDEREEMKKRLGVGTLSSGSLFLPSLTAQNDDTLRRLREDPLLIIRQAEFRKQRLQSARERILTTVQKSYGDKDVVPQCASKNLIITADHNTHRRSTVKRSSTTPSPLRHSRSRFSSRDVSYRSPTLACFGTQRRPHCDYDTLHQNMGRSQPGDRISHSQQHYPSSISKRKHHRSTRYDSSSPLVTTEIRQRPRHRHSAYSSFRKVSPIVVSRRRIHQSNISSKQSSNSQSRSRFFSPRNTCRHSRTSRSNSYECRDSSSCRYEVSRSKFQQQHSTSRRPTREETSFCVNQKSKKRTNENSRTRYTSRSSSVRDRCDREKALRRTGSSARTDKKTRPQKTMRCQNQEAHCRDNMSDKQQNPVVGIQKKLTYSGSDMPDEECETASGLANEIQMTTADTEVYSSIRKNKSPKNTSPCRNSWKNEAKRTVQGPICPLEWREQVAAYNTNGKNNSPTSLNGIEEPSDTTSLDSSSDDLGPPPSFLVSSNLKESKAMLPVLWKTKRNPASSLVNNAHEKTVQPRRGQQGSNPKDSTVQDTQLAELQRMIDEGRRHEKKKSAKLQAITAIDSLKETCSNTERSQTWAAEAAPRFEEKMSKENCSKETSNLEERLKRYLSRRQKTVLDHSDLDSEIA